MKTAILTLLFFLAAVGGWIMNIVHLFHSASDPITGMFILRCMGVVVPPLGAVLGYL